MSEQESKKQILKSTGILGSAQLVIILIGIVRVKVLAILLGASGVGIAGLYQSTVDIIKSATGLGIGYSAVRNIAADVASGDEKKISTTAAVLKRWVWATGLLGMIVSIVFSRQLSQMAFGNTSHSDGIRLLSLTLLLAAISSGQLALLQGFRRIGDIAKANVFSSLIGLISAIFIYYYLGVKGIVPALLVSYILSLFLSWFYARKIKIKKADINLLQVFDKGKTMVKLGVFLSITTFASRAVMYIVRSFIMMEGGVDSVGYFVAAWTISSMYISAIFGAMGSDFFPRLSSIQHGPDAVTTLVNEQTEVALLITAPIIIGMVSFIDLVVTIFYTKDFGTTADILDWQLMGDFFKVLAWPMGFIMLAKGKGKLFIVTELSWNLFFLAGVYVGWGFFDIQVTGIAFLASYVLYVFVVYAVARKLVQFEWSNKVKNLIMTFLPLLILAFLGVKYLSQPLQYITGALLTAVAVGLSYKHLKKLVNFQSILKRFG